MCCFDEAPTPPADPPADPPPGGGGLGWQLPSPYQLDRDGIIATAAAFVGFSYWWGGAKLPDPWEAAGKPHGSCSSGVHSGTYGADCSGFVADVWQLPEAVSFESTAHPFSTASFYNDRTHWRATTREQARRGDAMVYRSGGSGHIVILESFDSWGQAWTYEARGCSYGIVHNLRSLSSSYQARVREGL